MQLLNTKTSYWYQITNMSSFLIQYMKLHRHAPNWYKVQLHVLNLVTWKTKVILNNVIGSNDHIVISNASTISSPAARLEFKFPPKDFEPFLGPWGICFWASENGFKKVVLSKCIKDSWNSIEKILEKLELLLFNQPLKFLKTCLPMFSKSVWDHPPNRKIGGEGVWRN